MRCVITPRGARLPLPKWDWKLSWRRINDTPIVWTAMTQRDSYLVQILLNSSYILETRSISATSMDDHYFLGSRASARKHAEIRR